MSQIAIVNYDRYHLKVGTSKKYANVTIDMINIFNLFVKRARKRKSSEKRVCLETTFACLINTTGFSLSKQITMS